MEGAAEGAASLTKLAAGPLSDRYARRPLIATGYGMAALGKVIVAAATAWPGVLAGRVVDRLGKGIRGAPRDALLVDGHRRRRPRAGVRIPPRDGHLRRGGRPATGPGRLRAARPSDRAAAVGGGRARRAERGAGLPGAREAPAGSVPAQRNAIFARVREICLGGYWRVTVLLVAFGIVNFPDALLLLRLNEIGFSVVEVILAYVGYNLVYALSSYPAGLLADRIPRPAVFGIGLVFFAVGYIGLGLTTDTVTAWILIGVYGLFTGCTDGVGKAWISSLVGSGSAGQRAGCVPGRQRFRGACRRSVGRLPVGGGRSAFRC